MVTVRVDGAQVLVEGPEVLDRAAVLRHRLIGQTPHHDARMVFVSRHLRAAD